VIIIDELEPPVWQQVKTVLETLGAVYVVGASAFEFEADQDAHAVVSGALAAGRVMGAVGADGFVSTPSELAVELVDLYGQLHPPRGRQLRVLEPSAGVGRFVEAITRGLSPDWMRVVAVEPDLRRARQIPADRSVSVVVDTFEAYARRAGPAGERFDVVVMNPPSAVPRRGSLWAEHLLTAWELLEPGGRLVAVAPASVLESHHRSRAARQAATLVYEHGAGRRLEADAFAESGITYATAVVWLDRPLRDQPVSSPTPSPRYLFRTYTGEETPVPVTRPYLTRGAARSMPCRSGRTHSAGTGGSCDTTPTA
jgi:predicted RNA methylase